MQKGNQEQFCLAQITHKEKCQVCNICLIHTQVDTRLTLHFNFSPFQKKDEKTHYLITLLHEKKALHREQDGTEKVRN